MSDCEAIIYGSGAWGRKAYWAYLYRYDVICYVDRNPRRWGTRLNGLEIRPPEVFTQHSEAVVILAIDNAAGIEEYIWSLGITKIERYRYDAAESLEPAMIYGTGTIAREVMRTCQKRFRVCFFVDAADRPGEFFEGRRIITPQKMQEYPDACLIVPDADAGSLKSIRETFPGDILLHDCGRGIRPALSRMEDHHPCVFVDVTMSRQKKQGEGVARVADRLWGELSKFGTDMIPVWDMHGTLVTDFAYAGREREEMQVVFQKGDTLLLLDPSVGAYCRDFQQILKEAKRSGTRILAVVHDFIPNDFPELFSETICKIFFRWHDLVLSEADGILCDSKHTVKKAREYLAEHQIRREAPLTYDTIPLGGDMSLSSMKTKIRSLLKSFMMELPVFLVVGTIEPRKGHRTVLQAWELLRRTTSSARLLFLGHDGWLNLEIKEAMELHQRKDFLWIKDADDAELAFAYQHATGLIEASVDEGYGLPLVEAASFGLPVICSDIEVFHEVMGGEAIYVPVNQPQKLANAMKKVLLEGKEKQPVLKHVPTWQDAGRKLLHVLRGTAKPITNEC